MMEKFGILAIAALATTSLLGCQTQIHASDIPAITPAHAEQLNQALEELFAQHGVNTAGVGVIRDGELVWTGYFGEQRPGVPASEETLFNVASITKVVTAETLLRAVDRGALSLDEAMAPYWTDPDITDDPRTQQLTPRMALNHTTGFPNWRFFLDDNRLRFVNDPGAVYGYSGEGYEYLARYAEEKLGKPFDELVRETVFEPIGMEAAAYRMDEHTFDRIARPLDSNGEFHGHFCRPGGWCRDAGTYNAADDMVINVRDHAAFMLAVMRGDGYGKRLLEERNQVQTNKGDQASVECQRVPEDPCPLQQGYGLGWEVLNYGDNKLLTHGGSDWAEVALSYFYTNSHDGLIVFLNVPMTPGLAAMADAIQVIDPDSPLIELYRARAEKAARQARQ